MHLSRAAAIILRLIRAHFKQILRALLTICTRTQLDSPASSIWGQVHMHTINVKASVGAPAGSIRLPECLSRTLMAQSVVVAVSLAR